MVTSHLSHMKEQATHRVNDAIRSTLEKLKPALHLVKFPVLVSNETSVPSAIEFVPMTPEKLTTGLAVKPMLELIPTCSCKYWTSNCHTTMENQKNVTHGINSV